MIYYECLKGNRIRLLSLQKSIWLYTGYTWEEIISTNNKNQFEDLENGYCQLTKRASIVINCDILIDGRYIDSQRDITLKWCGSKNQRVINIQKSLEKREVVLWDIKIDENYKSWE